MKREDIEKAAKEEADKLSCLVYYGGSAISQEDVENAFVNGAEWRINSVWHDASEEPIKDEMILCADDLGYMWQSDFMLDKVFDKWSDFVKFTQFTKWAYSCDLLPEKGSV